MGAVFVTRPLAHSHNSMCLCQTHREQAFGKVVNLDSPAVLQALNRPIVLSLTERVFQKLLLPRLTEEHTPVAGTPPRLLSTTPPFPWSGKDVDVGKTHFNLTPCGNKFEQDFANFLNTAKDIATFANWTAPVLPDQEE